VQTRIDLAFADGVYTFDLGLSQINEIQNKCGAGIGAIYARVLKGRYILGEIAFGNPEEGEYRLEDLINVIRQGLIGGGKAVVDGEEMTITAHRANQLVEAYVLGSGQPLRDSWTIAAAILTARIEGYTPPEGAPKPKPDKKKGKGGTAGSITPEPSLTAP
jgi:hypothetical protein